MTPCRGVKAAGLSVSGGGVLKRFLAGDPFDAVDTPKMEPVGSVLAARAGVEMPRNRGVILPAEGAGLSELDKGGKTLGPVETLMGWKDGGTLNMPPVPYGLLTSILTGGCA